MALSSLHGILQCFVDWCLFTRRGDLCSLWGSLEFLGGLSKFAWGFIILVQLLWCSCICILSDISVCKRTIALFGHEPGALFFVPFFVSV